MDSKIERVVEGLVEAAEEKKCESVLVYDISEPWITECVMVVEVKNIIHCRSMLESFSEAVPRLVDNDSVDFFSRAKVAGDVDSGWVILDLNSVMIHCIVKSLRDYYQLDALFEKKGLVYHF